MHIIFEGPDGAGKSTLIEQVSSKLSGNILLVQQPGTTEAGKALRVILKGTIKISPMARQAMHMADTAEFCANLDDYKKNYDYVIQDRTSFISSPIYGKAERGGCDYHIDWYKHIATPKADRLFFIMSKRAEDQVRQRGDGDHFDNMGTSFHAKVYNEYLNFATDGQYSVYTDLVVDRKNLHVIQNDGSIEEATQDILRLIKSDF